MKYNTHQLHKLIIQKLFKNYNYKEIELNRPKVSESSATGIYL